MASPAIARSTPLPTRPAPDVLFALKNDWRQKLLSGLIYGAIAGFFIGVAIVAPVGYVFNGGLGAFLWGLVGGLFGAAIGAIGGALLAAWGVIDDVIDWLKSLLPFF